MTTRLKLVLTNDDGVDAPGLAALERACHELGSITIVAPKCPQSGVGHQVTTRGPLVVEHRESGTVVVDGTPADCARIALAAVAPTADCVISGINHGGNLGADIYISGTVAAAREAALLGRRAVAVSHYVARGAEVDWDLAVERLLPVLAHILSQPTDEHSFWNINLPHPSHRRPELEYVLCPVDPSPLHVRFRAEGASFVFDGDYHGRPRRPGSDVDICFGGRIAISRIPLVATPPTAKGADPEG